MSANEYVVVVQRTSRLDAAAFTCWKTLSNSLTCCIDELEELHTLNIIVKSDFLTVWQSRAVARLCQFSSV